LVRRAAARCSDRLERSSLMLIASQYPRAGAALRRYTILLAIRRYLLSVLEDHRKRHQLPSSPGRRGLNLLRAKTRQSVEQSKLTRVVSNLRIVRTAEKGSLQWLCERHEAMGRGQERLATQVGALRADVERLIRALLPSEHASELASEATEHSRKPRKAKSVTLGEPPLSEFVDSERSEPVDTVDVQQSWLSSHLQTSQREEQGRCSEHQPVDPELPGIDVTSSM
jgi:hypothetical protein